jgi:sirohydrochlorin ferrochelatase
VTGARSVAVVLASHGDRGGTARNDLLLSHVEAVRALTGFGLVTAGVLKGEPALEAALAEADASGAEEILVYPLFMADGYFTATVLPARIAAVGVKVATRILPPLGADPALADAMQADALAASRASDLAPAAARLLVVGHGSKYGPASAEATRVLADRIRRSAHFAAVETAFLEEPPLLQTALEATHAPTIVSGFFYGDGMHAEEDVPAAIAAAGAHAVYAGPAGRSAQIPRLIAAALLSAHAGAEQ